MLTCLHLTSVVIVLLVNRLFPTPRLERLQRIVTKVQMESSSCEEQLNQLDSQMQTVSPTQTPDRPQSQTGHHPGRTQGLCSFPPSVSIHPGLLVSNPFVNSHGFF